MEIQLHANATPPRVRAILRSSKASVTDLSRRFGISETTVRRWRSRDVQTDRSHIRHNLGQSTTPTQEAIIATLRVDARLSLDDITEVMQRCLAADLSRSTIWRCLRRQGLSERSVTGGSEVSGGDAAAGSAPFGETAFGFVHINLKHLRAIQGQVEFTFVALKRVSRFAHIEIMPDRKIATVTAAMKRFLTAFGYPVHMVLTDNGAEFTDRFKGGVTAARGAKPTGKHPFNMLCAAAGITHRLIRPYRPQTNGMVERFNRRIAEAIQRSATGLSQITLCLPR